MINLFQPCADGPEADAIADVLRSNWLGTGEIVDRFEHQFARYIGASAEQTLATTSCTEGLFQAVAALGLGPGDEVILPTISFVGAAHAARSTGARIALCDVDPETLNPTVATVEQAAGPDTKAVLVLHYGGEPGELRAISELAADRGWWLIEDAATGLGSFSEGRACGTFGDVGVWSFDAMKVLTTGDGGMVWCRSEEVALRIRATIRLGVGASGFQQRNAAHRWWELDPDTTGRRATMNNVAASIGLVQLARLPDFLGRRMAIAARYDVALRELDWLRTPTRTEHTAPHFYAVRSAVRDALARSLLTDDIYTSFRYWPLHRTRLYKGEAQRFPGAEAASASTLLLPLHQALSDADIGKVVASLQAFDPDATHQ